MTLFRTKRIHVTATRNSVVISRRRKDGSAPVSAAILNRDFLYLAHSDVDRGVFRDRVIRF